MNHRFSHSGPEQLPSDFPQSLRNIDAMLSKQSRQSAAPAGLADRVFAASRPVLMSATSVVETRPRLRLVGTQRAIHQSPWARLALAACVVMAFVVAFMALQPARNSAPRVASSNSAAQPERQIDFLALAIDAPHATSASHYEANLSYLIESQSIGADDLGDLKSELNELSMLVARF